MRGKMLLSYNTIIGRSPSLYKWHLDQVCRNAGLERDEYEINIYLYYGNHIDEAVTDELIWLSKQYGVNYELWEEDGTKLFGERLYKAWNRVQEMGRGEYVLRAGSDQAWSVDFLFKIKEYLAIAPQPSILQVQTIESELAGRSRHFMFPWGSTPETFRDDLFQDFSRNYGRAGLFTIEESLDIWGHPTHFVSSLGPKHNRSDGVSWVQNRELWKQHGPMSYLTPTRFGPITGDVIIHDKYEAAGVPNFLMGDVFSFHLVKGESR